LGLARQLLLYPGVGSQNFVACIQRFMGIASGTDTRARWVPCSTF